MEMWVDWLLVKGAGRSYLNFYMHGFTVLLRPNKTVLLAAFHAGPDPRKLTNGIAGWLSV